MEHTFDRRAPSAGAGEGGLEGADGGADEDEAGGAEGEGGVGEQVANPHAPRPPRRLTPVIPPTHPHPCALGERGEEKGGEGEHFRGTDRGKGEREKRGGGFREGGREGGRTDVASASPARHAPSRCPTCRKIGPGRAGSDVAAARARARSRARIHTRTLAAHRHEHTKRTPPSVGGSRWLTPPAARGTLEGRLPVGSMAGWACPDAIQRTSLSGQEQVQSGAALPCGGRLRSCLPPVNRDEMRVRHGKANRNQKQKFTFKQIYGLTLIQCCEYVDIPQICDSRCRFDWTSETISIFHAISNRDTFLFEPTTASSQS